MEIRSNYNAFSGKKIPENIENGNSQDNLSKSEAIDGYESNKSEKTGFFSNLKSLIPGNSRQISSESDDFRAKDRSYKAEICAATAGGVIGGLVGGIVANTMAKAEIEKLPIERITLDWQNPVMTDKVIGQIPKDYYDQKHTIDPARREVLVDAVTKAPVLNPDGTPVMQDMNKEFADHGKLNVDWQNRTITNPIFKGFSERTIEDRHQQQTLIGFDSNNNPQYTYYSVTDGYYHKFKPQVEDQIVGSYKEPVVKFETGIDVGSRTMKGILIGSLTGAVSAAIATAAIKKLMEK